MAAKGTDVVIVGGGVIGLTLAYELAGEGVSVRVVERGEFGREASWAGAGILPPGNPSRATAPESQLRALSHRRWRALSETLRAETGIDNGFSVCGGIEVRLEGSSDDLSAEIAGWQAEDVAVEALRPHQLAGIEPALSPRVRAAYRLPDLGQVRNPRHLKALVAGCAARGVDLRPGQQVTQIPVEKNRVCGVQSVTGFFPAGAVCIAAGPWSEPLLAPFAEKPRIVPVRGQIVLLSMPSRIFRHVIQCGASYLVPRNDGRILVGSTEEWVGFDKRNTAGAVCGLMQFAMSLVPQLAEAWPERTWAGLRPGTPDGLPYLGRIPGVGNLYVAAGHFRSGLQMSPGTAMILSELILGRSVSMEMEAFSVLRESPRRQELQRAP